MAPSNKTDYYFIPNVIQDEKFSYSESRRTEIRKKMGAEDKIIIGTVGRLSPAKNPLFALKVIKEVIRKTDNDNIEYWWIGSGPLEDEFDHTAGCLGLTEKVRALGSREDVGDIYQAMDVLFMPSRFEGLGIAAIEAQAMGLKGVVSDNVPRMADYTGLISFLSLRASTDEWADAIIESIGGTGDRRSYSDALKNSAFSEKNAGERLALQYRQMLSDRK